MKVCCSITFWLLVLFSLTTQSLHTIILFLLFIEQLPRVEIYCYPFSTHSLHLYCQDVQPEHHFDGRTLVIPDGALPFIGWQEARCDVSLSSISATPQKFSVTRNLISYNGTLLLLLQDTVLCISSSLDSALLRTAFCSVSLIQIFGSVAFVVGFEEFRKVPGPNIAPSLVTVLEIYTRNISLELSLLCVRRC